MFYDNFVKLCADRKESPSGVARKIGLSNAAASGWKNGKVPSDTTLLKLSEYFGVSIDDLVGKSELMFYDKFKELCEKKGVSCNKAAIEIGLSNATPTTWKKRGLTPKSDTLAKISDYFGVTTDYLLGTEQKEKPTGDADELDEKLINKLVDLTPEELIKVTAFIDGLKAGRG